MLQPEQITQIKKQIIQQIGSTFPEDKKQSAIQQIESMNSEQLEEFLKQNNLIKQGENSEITKCIFCSIISGQAQSYKIDENSDAIAILEINPISKAHSIVISKKHSEKISKKTMQLAEKIKKKIKTKFKPKNIETIPTNLFGHQVINILPIYTDETINSEKHQAKPEELEKLKKQLEKKTKPKIIKQSKPEKIKEKLWLPQRIP